MPEITPVQTSVLERFLRYVTVDTQSDENSTTYPSTAQAARAAATSWSTSCARSAWPTPPSTSTAT